MTDEELRTIGRFAQLSGLSTHALRHYDDVGLLEPAVVDAETGLPALPAWAAPAGRLISSLRWIDLPIDEIRQVDDLDAVHKRAIAAGATEAIAPRQPQGMPRGSAVRDPDGNIIWLAQG